MTVPRASEVVQDLFRDLRETHPLGAEQFSSLLSASQYRKAYEVVLRRVPRGARVLDWGCGRGHFSYFLSRFGYEVAAYSLEEEPEIFAVEPVPFLRASDPTNLPFPSDSFDAVVGVGVFEHVRETGGSESANLAELARVLRPGGLLLFFHVPNRASYIEALSRWLNAAGFSRSHWHRRRFSLRELADLSARAGLLVVECGRYGLIPRNSLSRLPGSVANSRVAAAALSGLESLLAPIAGWFAQNLYLVGVKSGRRNDLEKSP
jgi:SAM-dependent methyltransferase